MGSYPFWAFQGGKGPRPRPMPVPRGPLPPWDPDATDPDTGAPLPVRKTINGAIPPPWTDGYLRSNLWGVTLDYLPVIDGGATGPAQARLLTYLLYAVPRALWPRVLKDYGERGYEVFWLSIPDARDRNGGMSVADYEAMSQAVYDSGLDVGHFLRSKDEDGRDPDPIKVAPYVDALYAAGLIQWGCHGWEASLFDDPEALRAQIHFDALRWPKVKWCVHLQQGYADFGPDGEGHGPKFWEDCISVGVKRLLYQYKADPPWSAGMMQARGNDVSVRLVQGGVWGLSQTVEWFVFEQCGVELFNNLTDGDGRLATEDTADLKGLEGLCTAGPLPPSGFGNGARMPDGAVI
jgi:hypothetical protein